MMIISEDGRQCVNADYPERFCLVEKPDATLVIASYRDDRPVVTLGRYKTLGEARGVFSQLIAAFSGDCAVFDMPPSLYYSEQCQKRDARTRRKGGS